MSPLPHFATGDPLGAAEANLIARQGVITVPTVAARDNLPAPHDGMVCFVEADQTYYVRIEGVWRVGWRASTSPMVQRGTAARSDLTGLLEGQNSGNATVTFPVPFPGTPVVIVGSARATFRRFVAGVSGESPTGFTFTVQNVTPSTVTAGTYVFPWIAVY